MTASTLTTVPVTGRLDANSEVVAFPLERPLLKARRRSATGTASPLVLPYFLAGPENRLAAYVARQEASLFELGNPVLFVGPTGSGKTSLALHLAVRYANQLGWTDVNSVVHCPAIDFARRYADAVAADVLASLREEIEQAPVLILDDLQLITTKHAAQDELALRIDARVEARLPTLLTCRRLPTEVRGLRPSLVSRSIPGLTVPIHCPGPSTRPIVLRELAMQHGLDLDASMYGMLEEGLDKTAPVRALAAVMKQIDLWCRMKNRPPCCEAVEAAIQSVSSGQPISIAKITNTVARHFRHRASDLRSSSRKQHWVRARSLAMLLARRLTSLSMNDIGEYFGGRDHTTVLHAIRKTDELLLRDADLRLAADELTEKLSA
ncbi:DnaA/Hda family protein [Novipirellula artificiosorum]|uniref:Chromosomal replication initiator protein DnaA n=1 Tax=Novipirellula artificiosorum TaxID=2528016 RepID=A0A5C6DTW9_9BACT|nr:helix-turn-helix domain-containing protein [Novipirellula artificiosorum]TWU40803.1 Chromosomal replication initiator protein DnaA [Novipirellula artificiosorum]